MRVAALDLGTNTTRLLVADVTGGRVDEIVRRTAITRLGEGVDRRRRLLPAALARVRNALVDYRREAELLGVERSLLVATSAVRDAENGEAFLAEIEWTYGLTTRLLDGREEAELAFRGAASGGLVRGRTLVLDVGGGSTEVIVGNPDGIEQAVSLQIGSVRLTERFVASDPPAPAELAALRAYARNSFPPAVRADHALGVAGTVTTIAALDLGLDEYDRDRVHGHPLTIDAVEAQLARLAALALEERLRVPALEPGRAPVIVAGAAIVAEAMAAYELAELVASEHDLLDGVALAAAELPEPEEGAAPPGAYTAC
jgi:exopolyphosphatase/guanosine-5'-triphosphate,3'-diphosphate pyrophosphatase